MSGSISPSGSGLTLIPALSQVAPGGTTALTAQTPDSTAAAGNARGTNATDWQTNRASATQVASGSNSTIGGGANNTASGSDSTVGGGSTNTASALRSLVAGGFGNTADGSYSAVPGGSQASTRTLFGKLAFASGRFSVNGDAQIGEHVLRKQTTDATPTTLTADSNAAGSTNTINLPNNSAFGVRLMLIARAVGSSDFAMWTNDLAVARGANAAATVQGGGAGAAGPSQFSGGGSAWRLSVSADTTNGGLTVAVTGTAATTVNWVCRVSTVEVVG